jgi:anti-anti-sigma factor
MEAAAADLARAYDGMRGVQLELGYQRTADGHAMVNVRGELDIATAEQAHAYLRRVVDGEKKGKVTLNLANLTFCDAAGLGVLAKVASHARRTGRTLRVTAARPSLVRIMRITGMDEAFPEIRTPVLAMVDSPRKPPPAGAIARPPRQGTTSPG